MAGQEQFVLWCNLGTLIDYWWSNWWTRKTHRKSLELSRCRARRHRSFTYKPFLQHKNYENFLHLPHRSTFTFRFQLFQAKMSNDAVCFYSVLGIGKHSSDGEIRCAYRRMALVLPSILLSQLKRCTMFMLLSVTLLSFFFWNLTWF